jgi:N-acetylglucosaminyldiphosphoundecaprenol N-acetyl-beta-D-mannosaminyltransferase
VASLNKNLINTPFTLFEFDYASLPLTEVIRRILKTKEPYIVVTPNIDHIVRATNNVQIRNFYNHADLCLNDSKVLETMVRIFLHKSLSTVTGSDLTQGLLKHNSLKTKTITIVGCQAEQIVKLRHSECQATKIKHINPPMKFYQHTAEINKICDFVVESEADFIFLAVGSPQQEMLAHKIKPLLSKGVILCVGASIDYLTGKEKRAPLWVQQIRMEWFYRFLQSPIKRFKRYFINCPQIFYLLWEERQKLKKVN